MGAVIPEPSANSDQTVSLIIGSRLENLSMVHALIQGLVQRYELEEDLENALTVAVIEAGTNAIQHGNGFADDKSVTFRFTVRPRDILVRVEDSGRGFDPATVADPTENSQLLIPHGRGIYLMRSLMDEVAFDKTSGDGTSVLLRKARLIQAR